MRSKNVTCLKTYILKNTSNINNTATINNVPIFRSYEISKENSDQLPTQKVLDEIHVAQEEYNNNVNDALIINLLDLREASTQDADREVRKKLLNYKTKT
jgi:hypothetical protein